MPPAIVSTSPRPRRNPLAEVWQFREMLRNLIARNLKVKYQKSTLGFIWTLLNPLLTVGILVVIFTHVVRIPVPAYWAFLLSGYFAWNYVQLTLSTGTYTLAEHASLTRSVAFPAEVLLFSGAASRLVEFLAELTPVVVVLAVVHHQGVPVSFLLLPVLVLLLTLMTVGLLLPLSTLSVFYTDVQHLLGAVLLMLFYVSPVFYPASMVPEGIRDPYFLNPFAGLLTLFHSVLYEGRFPPAPLFAATAATAFGIFLIGYAIFNRHKHRFPEIL